MPLGNITVRTAVAQAPIYPNVEGMGLFVGAGVQSLGCTTPLTAFGEKAKALKQFSLVIG